MPTRLIRRHLVDDDRLSEPLVRRAAAELAELLAGGENGFSWNYGEAAGRGYDPDGYFRLVTEGRQCRWKGPDGRWHAYSACEDLHGAVFLRLCGMPPVVPGIGSRLLWCNRVEADRRWRQGKNLLSLKENLKDAWKRYHRGTTWDIGPGDAVQIQGEYAHTFVVLDVRYVDGAPAVLDHADYGRHHQPKGADRADHSCRVYRGAPVTDGPKGWHINGKPIIGRASVWDVVRFVWEHPAAGYGLPAWVPEGFAGGLDADNPNLPPDTDPPPPESHG